MYIFLKIESIRPTAHPT